MAYFLLPPELPQGYEVKTQLSQKNPEEYFLAHGIYLGQIPPTSPETPLPQDIDPPGSISSPTLELEPAAPQTPEDLLTAPEEVPERPASLSEEDLQQQLRVSSLRFEGNTQFDSPYLERQLTEGSGWQETTLTLAELLQLAEAVADIYQQAGYSTSGAIVRIPEETRRTGQGGVVIQVIEGSVERIQIRGTQRLRESYVRNRLPVTVGQPLNLRRLQEGLQLLQIDPLIQQVNAELTAGSETGSSILTVQIREADSFSLPIRLDNSRSPSVGSFQQQVGLSEGNLFGFGDSLLLSYSHTEGSDGMNFSYQIPVNAANGALRLGFSQTWNDVIDPVFFDLDGDGRGPDIESQSTQIEVSFQQPIIRTLQRERFQELVLGLTGSYRNNQSFLFGQPFPFSLSSDVDGTTKTTALRFFQNYTLQDAQQVFAVRSQFNFGISALGSTIQSPLPNIGAVPDSQFFSWQGQAQWARSLAPDSLFLLRVNAQLADQGLLSSEQFSLGGIYSVRGYRQDQLLTDNGLFASAEVRFPILQVPEWQGTLQIAPFTDLGLGWNSGARPDPDPNFLASVGLGLQWQAGENDRLRARLDWGIPLVSVPQRSNSWQENGIYFSVFFNPF